MARKIDESRKDANKVHGKHPRRLQFDREGGGIVSSYEAWIVERINLDRRLLTAGLSEYISLELSVLTVLQELPVEQPYTISLYLLMRSVDYGMEDARREALAVLASAEETFLKCNGIELENAQLITEEALTVSAMRQLKSWDYVNYLSRRPGHVPEPTN